MKSPARRLGRGLGAFLDFGPAGEDGETRVGAVIAQSASVLETSDSEPAAPPTPSRPAPAPPPAASSEPEASPFVDDDVVGLSFPEVELE